MTVHYHYLNVVHVARYVHNYLSSSNQRLMYQLSHTKIHCLNITSTYFSARHRHPHGVPFYLLNPRHVKWEQTLVLRQMFVAI